MNRRVLAIGLAVLALSGVAGAAPNESDKQAARDLMNAGRELRAKGDLAGALSRFRAADEIMHVPSTATIVAQTLAAMGKLVEAADKAREVQRMPVAPDEPEPFAIARKDAARLIDELSGRVPTLRVVVAGAPPSTTPSATIDGAAVAPAALAAGASVNPGHHVVRVTAGSLEKTEQVDVREREKKELSIRLGGGEAQASTAAPADEGGRSHVLTYVAFGVAGAAAIAGGVTGVLALKKTSDARAGCLPDGHCPPPTYDDLDAAHTFATVSTVSFVVAGVAGAVGVVSLFLGGPSKSATGSAPRVQPWIGLGSAGVGGRF